MSKVILSGYIEVPEADLDTVAAGLIEHIQLTRAEDGCLVFEISQDQKNPLRFNVYEEFESQASFQKHQERVRASTWGSITRNVQRQYQIEGIEQA
ncbi:MAG: putative quinol monooxygenase [Pseudomonadota bacterium]